MSPNNFFQFIFISFLVFLSGVLATFGQDKNGKNDGDDLPPETKVLFNKLAKDAQSKVAATRHTAYESIGEFGEKGVPLLRVLGNGILDPDPKVVVAVLDSMKKVDPEVYQQAIQIVVEKNATGAARWALENPKGKCFISFFAVDFFATKKPKKIPTFITADLITKYEPEDPVAERAIGMLLTYKFNNGKKSTDTSFFLGDSGGWDPVALGLKLLPRLPNKKAAIPNLMAISSVDSPKSLNRLEAFRLLAEFKDESNARKIENHFLSFRFDKNDAVREFVENNINKTGK